MNSKVVRWFKESVQLVWKWWRIMAGALSIPFALMAFFNLFPSLRLQFAVLAYVALWALVISQHRQISKLKSHPKKANIAAYDSLDGLIKQGEAMLEKFRKNESPLPTEKQFQQWDNLLIGLAESCATISERDRLRAGSVLNIASDEIMQVYVNVPEEHWPIVEKLTSKLKVSRGIKSRLLGER
jgi:hypothetical protein